MMVQRLDAGIIKDWRETKEGFLDLWITFSKVGPLIYQRSDGRQETEYLSESELFDEQSLATATGKPVTYQHPPEWVTKDNVRKYSRGSTSTKIIKDLPFATILATVHDGELIDIIKTGKAKEVSAGYTTNVVKDNDGKSYQKNRTYNHFAIVERGRAGSEVRTHLDSIAVQMSDADEPDLINRVQMDIVQIRERVARDEMIVRMRGSRIQTRDAATEADVDKAYQKYIERLKKPLKR